MTSTNPLQRLEPADNPLLALIFDRVDDSMLLEIAKADYGDDVDIHLAALHQIRANNIPIPMRWHPGEVLCLTRWAEWDSLSTKDGAISTRNHWMRLFACTVLIWASLEPENYEYNGDEYWNHIDGEDSTIIQFLDSALNLGEETSLAALQFLGWRMQCQRQRALLDEDVGNCPCYAVAMLLLWVSLVGGAASLEHRDPEMVSYLISVAHCNENFPISREIDECQLSQKWRDTIENILLDPTAPDYDRLGKAHASAQADALRTNPALQNFGLELIGAAGSH
jgi:hypothetical protein